jgi:hypothetical protein
VQRCVDSWGGCSRGILALAVKAAQVSFAVYAMVQARPFLGTQCPLFLAERVFVVYIFCVFDALATSDFWCCGDEQTAGPCYLFAWVARLLVVAFLYSSAWHVYAAVAREIAACGVDEFLMGWNFLLLPSLCSLPFLLVLLVFYSHCFLYVLTARDVHASDRPNLLQAE